MDTLGAGNQIEFDLQICNKAVCLLNTRKDCPNNIYSMFLRYCHVENRICISTITHLQSHWMSSTDEDLRCHSFQVVHLRQDQQSNVVVGYLLLKALSNQPGEVADRGGGREGRSLPALHVTQGSNLPALCTGTAGALNKLLQLPSCHCWGGGWQSAANISARARAILIRYAYTCKYKRMNVSYVVT